MISDGRLVPYEFYFEHGQVAKGLGEVDEAFVKDFANILEVHNLAGLLGLGLLSCLERKQLEVTEGRVQTCHSPMTFPRRRLLELNILRRHGSLGATATENLKPGIAV
jgi:hypothetical protein